MSTTYSPKPASTFPKPPALPPSQRPAITSEETHDDNPTTDVAAPTEETAPAPTDAATTETSEEAATEDTVEAPASTGVARHSVTPQVASSDWPAWYKASKPLVGSDRAWRSFGKIGLYNKDFLRPPGFWGSLEGAIVQNNEYLYELAPQFAGSKIAFGSGKGGTLKTTCSTETAAHMAAILPGLTLVIDGDTTTIQTASLRFQTDSAANLPFGFPAVAKHILTTGTVPSASEILRFAERHQQSGAYLLTFNEQKTEFTPRQMEYVINGLARQTALTIVDTPPGTDSNAIHGAVTAATVVGVTGLYKNPASKEGIMQTLNPDNFGLSTTFNPDKPVMIVIGAVPEAEFNRRTQFALAEDFGVDPDHLAILPDHEQIRDGKPVDRGAMSMLFRFAVSDLCRRLVEMAVDYNDLHKVVDPVLTAAPTIDPIVEAAETLLLRAKSAEAGFIKMDELERKRANTSS